MIGHAAVADDHAMPMDAPMHMPMDMPISRAGPYGPGEPGDAAEVTRTIAIVIGDADFAPAAIDVKQGDVIRFVLENRSSADHEFLLGDASTQAEHRAEMAKAMADGHAMHHHGGGGAITVKAGETQELIWKFTNAKNLEFGCNLPGHYEAGMKGIITVAP
jgi:uncharacterized cupredoxin-like copper-binding protein